MQLEEIKDPNQQYWTTATFKRGSTNALSGNILISDSLGWLCLKDVGGKLSWLYSDNYSSQENVTAFFSLCY